MKGVKQEIKRFFTHFWGGAKSYVGKDRYRIKVKKYLSFLHPYAFRLA